MNFDYMEYDNIKIEDKKKAAREAIDSGEFIVLSIRNIENKLRLVLIAGDLKYNLWVYYQMFTQALAGLIDNRKS